METKERDSNIELLRIILMFSIILHHLVYHNYVMTINGENYWVANILGGFAKVAVNCFILIMGFFGSKSKYNIKKVIKLSATTLFYAIVFMLIFEGNVNKQILGG